MKPLSDREAIIGLRNAQLQAGHALNTRKTYRGWMLRYRALRKSRVVRDLQGFLTYLATVERVNPKTVKQALNALKFYHEKVLGIEIPPNSLTLPKVNPHRMVADKHYAYGARPYSVREYARLQGVPDSFRFEGSDRDAYRMIGNGVSVPVGEWIGREVTRYFGRRAA